MARSTGTYRISRSGDEEVRAFVPAPLPPRDPPLAMDDAARAALGRAEAAVAKLTVAADDGMTTAQKLIALTAADHRRLARHNAATVPAIHLLESLPGQPVVTLASAIKTLGVTKPTAMKATSALQQASILRETTGQRRDRVYAYRGYLKHLTTHTE